MDTFIWRALGAGLLAAIALPSPAHARFYGLSSGQVSSFTRSPGGCVISLLFDDFRAPRERPTNVPGPPTRSFTLASSPESVGRRMNIDVRGARLNANDANILLRIAGQPFNLRPKADGYSVRAVARTNRSSADTLVQVSLVLPEGAKPGDSRFMIDSIDVSLPGCSSRAGKR